MTGVCLEQFINVVSISRDRLTKLKKEMLRCICEGAPFFSPDKDKRGKHDNRPLRVAEEVRESIHEYMGIVLRKHGTVAHYSRRHARNTIYLPATMNVPGVWTGWLQYAISTGLNGHEETSQYLAHVVLNRENSSATITAKPLVTREWFAALKFFRPKTDQCATCSSMLNKIELFKTELIDAERNGSGAAADDLRLSIESWSSDLDEHRKAARFAYDSIQQDYKNADDSKMTYPNDKSQWITTFVFDFQQKRVCPNLKIKQTFFKDQLYVHNLDIYARPVNRHHFMLWPEWTAGAGPDEVLSTLSYLSEKLQDAGLAGNGKHWNLEPPLRDIPN